MEFVRTGNQLTYVCEPAFNRIACGGQPPTSRSYLILKIFSPSPRPIEAYHRSRSKTAWIESAHNLCDTYFATMMNMTNNVLLCALSSALLLLHGDVAAADSSSGVGDTISARRLRNHRMRPHDEQPQGVIKRDDNGNTVAAPQQQQLRGHVDTPSQTQPPPFRPQQTRIVNGDIVAGKNGDYPFQVQVGGWLCGGSLIAPDVVLTAAHCIIGGSPSHVNIWDGSRKRMTPRTVQSAVMHPRYKSDRLSDDIALIKLSGPALAVDADWDLVDNYDWGNHPPMIRLQRYQTPSGCTSLSQDQAEGITTMTVIGHGTVAYGGQMSGQLLEADLHYVQNS
eukprot:scaffold1031_cov125-Skeletonema_dohrnii-CCMP3373.AAC.2